MTEHRLSVEDLSAFERRGVLDSEQSKRLERELSSSLVERVVHDAGRDFDALDWVQPGDSDLLARVTQATLATRKAATPKPVRSHRRQVIGVVTALALTATAAAALTNGFPVTATVEATPQWLPVAARVEQVGRDSSHVLQREVQSVDIQQVTPFAVPLPSAQSNSDVLPGVTGTRVGQGGSDDSSQEVAAPLPEAVEVTSKELFSTANAARRRGDVEAAIAGYHELQAKFPGSSEAVLSRVSLGNLSLRRGASAQALEQFDAYLRQQAGGSLREEALRGKAEALGRLGRKAEARAAWKALLTQYPDSAYADLARSHLD